jgi:hypothetical protein
MNVCKHHVIKMLDVPTNLAHLTVRVTLDIQEAD